MGATTVTTSFDAANRPTSDSASGTYSHDADGNTLTMPGYQLTWDSLGRLTQVKDGSANVLSTYTYDALDRLRDVTSSGVTIRHRYVGITTQLAQLRNVTAGSSILKFGSSWDGTMLAQWVTTTSGRRYYGTNGHGDLTWTAGNGGSVNSTRRYDPWGGIVASSGTHPELRFQGSWRDPATGLYWVVARWYAPQLGTFLSEDSLLGAPQQPATRHLYTYGGGNPIVHWDVNGRYWGVVVLDEEARITASFENDVVWAKLTAAVGLIVRAGRHTSSTGRLDLNLRKQSARVTGPNGFELTYKVGGPILNGSAGSSVRVGCGGQVKNVPRYQALPPCWSVESTPRYGFELNPGVVFFGESTVSAHYRIRAWNGLPALRATFRIRFKVEVGFKPVAYLAWPLLALVPLGGAAAIPIGLQAFRNLSGQSFGSLNRRFRPGF